MFFFLLFSLPLVLNAWWGDGDKLKTGACKFDKETGHSRSPLYTKGKEAFVIIDMVDTRYGTTSTVYNALTCEKVTSGAKAKSDFEGLLLRKGFTKASTYAHHNVDKTFSNKVDFSQDSDSVIVKTEAIDSEIGTDLQHILANLTNKKASTKISISKKSRDFLKYAQFSDAFKNKIEYASPRAINYGYALKVLSLHPKLNKNKELKKAIFHKYFRLKVKKVSDIPKWIKGMKRFKAESYIADSRLTMMDLPDFAKHLTLNNFLSSKEYKYSLKYQHPSISSIRNRSTYGLMLNYGLKKIKLTSKASCKSTGSTTSEFGCGLLWANTCVGTYAHYKCKANIAQLSKIEKTLRGSTKVASGFKGGWKYNYETSRYTKVNNYANAASRNYAQAENSSSNKSSSSSYRTYNCTFKCKGGLRLKGSVNVNAKSNHRAQIKSAKIANKQCKNLGSPDGVLSQWGTGSTDCN